MKTFDINHKPFAKVSDCGKWVIFGNGDKIIFEPKLAIRFAEWILTTVKNNK